MTGGMHYTDLLCRVTNVKVFFLVLVHVFNFDLFEFLAAILEKGLLYQLYPTPVGPAHSTAKTTIIRESL